MDEDSQPLPLPPLALRTDDAGRRRGPVSLRLYDSGVRALPVLVLALLAGLTWWQLHETHEGAAAPAATPVDTEPDYEMSHFAVSRYGTADATIQGDRLRHFPRSDELQIDGARLSLHQQGTGDLLATAPQARLTQQGAQVLLSGGAQVVQQGREGEAPLRFESERLVIDRDAQTVRTELPVVLQQGDSAVSALSLHYDHAQRQVTLTGAVRGRLSSR